jgi:hypothetical protein
VAAQERRRHDQILLGRQLPLEFLREINERTSAFHGETSQRNAETADP